MSRVSISRFAALGAVGLAIVVAATLFTSALEQPLSYDARAKAGALEPGGVVLLENLRFSKADGQHFT